VNSLPHVLQGQENANIEIAAVNLAFKNGKIIKLVQDRGTAIANGQYGKLDKMEQEIQKAIKTNWVEVTTPIKAFIIFKT